MLEKTLLDYWFTVRQAKIYLICLELGNAPASSIARKMWENRVTVYSALKDMCKRWIAFELIKNDIRYYAVISPNDLLRYEKKKFDKLNEILPNLMSIWMIWQSQRPKVYCYEWFDAIKDIYEDQLKSSSWKYSFIGTNTIPKILQKYIDEFHDPKRIERKIFSKQILPTSINNKEHAIKDKSLLREYKIVNNSVFYIHWDITLYNSNKVSICSYPSENDIFGVVIENKYLHDTLLSLFNLIRDYQK